MIPLEIVQTTSPQINVSGAAFYFHPDTLARGKELGLRGFPFYFLSRGAVLGDVGVDEVTAAFGYFHRSIIEMMWTPGRVLEARPAAEAYLECGENLGRSTLGDVAGLDAFNDAAEAVVAGVEPGQYALFDGLQNFALPTDVPGRAYRNLIVMRELRGDVHLAAIREAGVPTEVAHAMRRPNDTAAFGWDPAPEVTDAHREAMANVDARTDQVMVPMIEALDDSQRAAFLAGSAAAFAIYEQANRFQNRS